MKAILIIIAGLAITGCANRALYSGSTPYMQNGNFDTTENSIHYYVEQLARQLFLTSQAIKLNQSVAVGTFLPITDLGGKHAPLSNALGQQIQESLVTLAAQAGLNVIEFKTTKAIKIQKNQDVMLSRQVNELNPHFDTDYYLTGTYYTQNQNVVVNVRLIEVATSNVIAAATDFMPASIISSQPGMARANATTTSSMYGGFN